jgi:rhamnose utilization protein RhaD (predicted bifunctional aldolase and dehydrogenase)
MNIRTEKLAALLSLSHELGNLQRPLSILGEGNTSTRLSEKTFLVKASGSNLGTLGQADVVECKAELLLSLLDRRGLSDEEIDSALMESRVDATAKKPSVEALFHAWLLTLKGIEFVGHTHAPAVNGILCSSRAKEFATKRIFPDEIVCCDVESVFVPYTDPDLRFHLDPEAGDLMLIDYPGIGILVTVLFKCRHEVQPDRDVRQTGS